MPAEEEGTQPTHMTVEVEKTLPFCRCRKTRTTARPVTPEDIARLGGWVETNEGRKRLRPGDYLGRDQSGGHENIWPLRQTNIEQNYRRISEPDTEGWADYEPLGEREACQMADTFETNGLVGRAGYYLVRNAGQPGACWPVAPETFEESYIWLDEAEERRASS